MDYVHVSISITMIFPKSYVTINGLYDFCVQDSRTSQALTKDRAVHCNKIRKDRWPRDQVPDCLTDLELS